MQSRIPARSCFGRFPVLAFALLVGLTAPLAAQERPAGWDPEAILQQEDFAEPPSTIAEAVLAPRWLNVTLSDINAGGDWFLHSVGDGPVTMDRFALPFHDLGGQFIDHRANRDRALTIRSDVGIQVVSATDGTVRDIQVPSGARVTNASWSPDGTRVAFFAHTPEATHLYVAGLDGEARRVTPRPVLATGYTSFDWSTDGSTLATVLVPRNRAPMPTEPAQPRGPQIKVTEDGENMLRVFKSLIATPHEKDLVEWHNTGQVALIDAANGDATEVGDPVMVRSLDASADGRHVLVERMVRPFSYVVPVRMFGSIQEIWDRDGDVLAEVRTDPLDTGLEGGPRAGGPGFAAYGEGDGPRDIAWRTDGSGLVYLERAPRVDAEEDEDETSNGDRPDRLILWRAPFGEADREVLFENELEMEWARFGDGEDVVFIAEEDDGEAHHFAVFLGDTDTKHTLARFDAEDVYEDPGVPVAADGTFASRGGRGWSVDGDVALSTDAAHVFYQGVDYHESPLDVGPRSYVDRIQIRTGERTRIYAADEEDIFEEPRAYRDLEGVEWVVTRESSTEVPQSYLRSGDALTQLTENIDYTPDLTLAPRETFTVTRPDGFQFRVNVTLPTSYQEGDRLPAMFWFYPREYTEQEEYDETLLTHNKNAFPNFGTRSIEYLIRMGYAVVEPDAPIVGSEGRMNDNYQHDLRNNLAAVIDELDLRGIIDRRRLGLGGHSYGAFGTVNAMVHTPFFKAGIAGDGNYNRTLTPLHFQSERRTLWEARETYLQMSPFMWADRLTGSLLLYHGLHDQNVGTDPIHSPKLFHALNGLGKDVAMYLYENEDHGPAARETLLDLWARWTAWLDSRLLEQTRPNLTSDQDEAGPAQEWRE
ncbi:MAG: prolyl oligopeptidase family serine peptidase [Gemmatimonadota bacterium]